MMEKYVIGVTGNIASGKSETSRMLREKGCALVDADMVAHELYGRDPALVQQLAQQFGQEIMLAPGILNRQRLGSMVFGKPEAMAILNRIVHPVLVNVIRERIIASKRVMNRVVLDAALIIELGFAKEVDYLVLVSGSVEVRMERLMGRGGLSLEEARLRIESQIPEETKLPHADFVIKNESTREYLQAQVDTLWEELQLREKGEGESGRDG